MKTVKRLIIPVFLILSALMFAEVRDRATLKTFFEVNDRPTEVQFVDLIDSMALVSELSGGIKDWDDEQATYALGDVVINGTTFYKRVTIAGNEDPFDTANWQELSPSVETAIPGAVGITFDDSTSSLGVSNTQAAIDSTVAVSRQRVQFVPLVADLFGIMTPVDGGIR